MTLKLFSRIVVLATSLMVGFAVGTAAVFDYERSSFRPWAWPDNDDPVILNCYGEDFNELYLTSPIDYWVSKGHKIAFVEQTPHKELCKNDMIDGFIVIKKRTFYDGGTLALTKRKVILGKIRAATIYFNPGAYRLDNVIEHELGHAFGYTHIEVPGHIMHPDHGKMGRLFWMP